MQCAPPGPTILTSLPSHLLGSEARAAKSSWYSTSTAVMASASATCKDTGRGPPRMHALGRPWRSVTLCRLLSEVMPSSCSKASLDRQKVYEALKMLKEAFAPWYSLLATSRSVKPSKDANCSLHEGYLCTGAPRHIEFAPGRGCSYSTQGRLCW